MKRATSIVLAFTLALLISACNFPFVVDSEDVMATSVAETVEALEARVIKPTLAPLPTQGPAQPDKPGDDKKDWKDDDDWDEWDDDNGLYEYCREEYCDCMNDQCDCRDGYYDCKDGYYDDKGGWSKYDYRDLRPGDQCLYATVTSETIPDGTDFSAGESFTKSWTFRNDGYCDWNTDYAIAFKSGDQMGGPDSQDLATEIDPDEIITISIDLTAPSTEGRHTGYWQLETDDGVDFGKVWVTIDVE